MIGIPESLEVARPAGFACNNKKNEMMCYQFDMFMQRWTRKRRPELTVQKGTGIDIDGFVA